MSRSKQRNDLILLRGSQVAAALVGSLVLMIVFYLIRETMPILGRLGFVPFFFSLSWNPLEQLYNVTPMLLGSVLVSAGALILATPLGFLYAIFCRFYAPPRLARLCRALIELLSGIPSVVFGFWGLMVLVPRINQLQPPGASLLAGILIVGLMILPTLAMLAESAFSSIPLTSLQGAYALGLDRLAVLRAVVFPQARSGLWTSILLGAGRGLGETMAVILVTGNVVQVPTSLFDPVRTLTANIALEMAYAVGDHRAALFVSGFVLICLVLGFVSIANWISRGVLREV